MKKYIFVCLISLVTSEAFTKGKPFPTFENVLDHFFDHYKFGNDDFRNLHFSKRQKGYYIRLIHTENAVSDTTLALLWNSKKSKYSNLKHPFESLDSPDNKIVTKSSYISHFLPQKEHTEINLHHYYGYIGWKDDVIQLLDKKKELTDDELYSLGRIYDDRSTELLDMYSAYPTSNRSFHLPRKGQNLMTQDQLNEFLSDVNKAVGYFEQLKNRNPSFTVLIGSIENKLANIYVNTYWALSIFQNEEFAKTILKDSLYPDFTINDAKNILGTVSQNGVLLTFGDNDTYPLLYTQTYLNYRPDVRLINMSLLNTSYHNNYLRDLPHLLAPPLKYSIPSDMMGPDTLSYMMINKKSEQHKGKSFIEYMKKPDFYKDLYQDDNNSYLYPTEEPIFRFPDSTIYLPITADSNIMIFPPRVLYASNIHLFDLISSNLDREFFCTSGKLRGIDEHFKTHGILRKYGGTNNDDNNFDLLMDYELEYNKNEYVDLSDHNLHIKRIVATYRLQFSKLAKSYINSNQNQKAVQLLNKISNAFPSKDFTYNVFSYSLIETYYKAKLTKQGDSATNSLIDAFEKEMNCESPDDQYLRFYSYYLNKLKDEEIDNPQIITRIEQLPKY